MRWMRTFLLYETSWTTDVFPMPRVCQPDRLDSGPSCFCPCVYGGCVFIDDSPSKQGMYTPIYHIPILSRKRAFKKKIDYILILAVNYADIIMSKEADFKKSGGHFIIPRGEDIQII